MYEVFEHTADLGLRIRAADLNALFSEAGRALMSVLLSDPDAVRPRESLEVKLAGGQVDFLLLDWLDELLHLFESRRFVARDFDVAVCAEGLSAGVRGEPLDLQRHAPAHEVKAITYHGLKVEQGTEGWLAEVILDI